MCLNLCLYSAILLGILYLSFGAFNLVFTNVYDFTLWQVSLIEALLLHLPMANKNLWKTPRSALQLPFRVVGALAT